MVNDIILRRKVHTRISYIDCYNARAITNEAMRYAIQREITKKIIKRGNCKNKINKIISIIVCF